MRLSVCFSITSTQSRTSSYCYSVLLLHPVSLIVADVTGCNNDMPTLEVGSDRIRSHNSTPSVASTFQSSPNTALVNQTRGGAVLPIHLPPSPADSDMSIHERPSSSHSARTREETRLTRKLDRGAPGDQAIFSENKSPEQRQLARKRSQYYQETFAAQEPNSSARERVSRDSMVIAEIKTNVIVSPSFVLDQYKSNPA